MLKDYTDVTFVIDRSGSMDHLRSDVIGGYNSFIDDQKTTDGKCTVTLVQFDDQYEPNYEAVLVESVDALSIDTYQPRGMTAMYDAIGKTINSTGKRLAAMKEEDRPSKVIFIIQTDGFENASQEYSGKVIKDMIEAQEKEFNWEFVFMGANINAKSTAMDIGIKSNNAMTFAASGDGLTRGFKSLSSNVSSVRLGRKVDMSYTSSDYKDQSDIGQKQ